MTVRDRRAVVWSVVVAAGSGERFGGDKQAADLAGQPVVVRSVRAAASVSDGVVVVVAANRRSAVIDLLAGLDGVEAVVDCEALDRLDTGAIDVGREDRA